jgi:membrane protease YdiL (CAAX protease family)
VLGYAASCALGLRFLVGWYVTVWPQALGTEAASIPSLTNQLMLATLKSGGPLTLIATTALLVPFLEEVLFRGVILEGLSKHVPFGWANAIQAVCFAIAHENIGLLPFYVLFGVTCGWLARRSGGLLTSILVHAANNLIVCIALIARN